LSAICFAPFAGRDPFTARALAVALRAFDLADDCADVERERAWDFRELPARFGAALLLV
jgi:hypothetical protein